ncbi:MAG: hypothetical protein LBO09_09100 [Candidatus Peribacteria bacterium]|nr:hypothetical protein [Candidatus Peribacteria bacterium]
MRALAKQPLLLLLLTLPLSLGGTFAQEEILPAAGTEEIASISDTSADNDITPTKTTETSLSKRL